MSVPQSREDDADDLRDQAASCRRLANRARTGSGWAALLAVANHFETDADRIDPRALRALTSPAPFKDQR